MGLLRKIFGKEKEAKEEQIIQPLEYNDDLICDQCNMPIHSGQRIKTFAGKKMHMKPCWFKLRKTAKNLM